MSAATEILQKYWGYDTFRDLQEPIIHTVLQGNDCIALLPTGGGKSLCYQVPALLVDGLTLVVSPLISLMQDQVQRLKQLDIPAEYIHSGLSRQQVNAILEDAEKGNLRLLYVSPERLRNRSFLQALPYLKISLIAVDEAHCISQWGHDFRPEYLQIRLLREQGHKAPIMALSASASAKVLEDIQIQLGIREASVFRKSFARPNIHYTIHYTENKIGDILRFFRQTEHCSIIYCRSRRRTQEISSILQQHGVSAAAFHAGLPREQKQAIQQAWMQDEIRVMVATTAFGMGIDKADVRTVLHFDPPENPEAYYQETGRAGRDGAASRAILLYQKQDLQNLAERVSLHFPPEDYLRKIYQYVCDFLQIPTGTELDDYYEFDLETFLKNFKLESIPATHALRLLGQEGLWSLNDAVFRPAMVQIIAARNTLDQVQEQYPRLSVLITGMLRLYTGIFHYPVSINIFGLARKLQLKKDEVETMLLQLHAMNLLDYKPAHSGPMMHVHHYRVAARDLIIDHKRIALLRNNEAERIRFMTQLLENTDQCVNRLLLNYFNEQSEAYCGHCFVCTGKARKTVPRQSLPDRICSLLQEKGGLSVAELIEALPDEQSADTIEAIRRLCDAGTLRTDEWGRLQPNPAA